MAGEDASKIICFCYGTTRGDILEAIQKDGARDAKRIGELTLAATGCGGCEIDVILILEELAKKGTLKPRQG